MKCLLSMTIIAMFALSTAGGQTIEHINIEGAVGWLSAVVQKPALKNNETCPIVILCHGFGGNKEAELLEYIADTLQAHNIASVRFDFNGHGESEGEFVDMTVPKEIDDAKCVYRYVASLPYVDTTKIGIAGHSQGGVVTGMVAGDLGHRICAIVLMAPAAVLRDDAIRGNTMGAKYNPLDPPEYVVMPDKRKLGREFIRSAFRLPIYDISAKYHGPACLIHGTGDRIAPYTYSERYHAIWPGSELLILEGVNHGFSGNMGKVASMVTNYFVRYLVKNKATMK